MFDPDYDAGCPAIRQTADWTCSACSWAWLATAIGTPYTEYDAVAKIGVPDNINPQYGLMDATGARLAESYSEAPLQWPSHYSGISWSDALNLAANGPLLLGGAGWYHWTAVRGQSHGVLWLANPAPSWFNVGDDMDEGEWNALGPWNAVWLAG